LHAQNLSLHNALDRSGVTHKVAPVESMQDEVRQFGWEVQLVAITAFADKAVLTRVRKSASVQ